uniref:Uncharacterized protein n=1 Tax=Anguilla anguilla TaxID=7936 RepID=A0A0E9Q0L0_ANGAN
MAILFYVCFMFVCGSPVMAEHATSLCN